VTVQTRAQALSDKQPGHQPSAEALIPPRRSEMKRIAAWILLGLLGPSTPLLAQVVTIGRMSEEVVRMRLKQEGYRDVKSLKKREEKFTAKAVKDGRKLNLEINVVTGQIKATP